MPKYWEKQIFTNESFPELGQKLKTEKKEEERTMVITMAKLRMAHTSTHGAHKPPGPKLTDWCCDSCETVFHCLSLNHYTEQARKLMILISKGLYWLQRK